MSIASNCMGTILQRRFNYLEVRVMISLINLMEKRKQNRYVKRIRMYQFWIFFTDICLFYISNVSNRTFDQNFSQSDLFPDLKI